MNRIRALMSLVALLLATTPAGADVFDYHPASGLHLGGGYDPAYPTEPYVRSCVSSSGEHNIDTPQGIADAKYELYSVSSHEELYKALSVSASADASFGFFSASGSVASQSQFSSSSDSITWIAKVSLIYGRYQPVDAKPIPAIGEMSAADITSTCGTQIVTQETRGVIATIVFTFNNISTAAKQALQASISGNGNFGEGDAHAKSDYKNSVEAASRSSELRITVEVRGGPGKEALESIAKADSDLEKIRAALATYIAQTTETNIRAFSYETSSTRQFYPKVGIPQLNSGRDEALVGMYSTYSDLAQTVARIQGLIKVPGRPQDEYLNRFVSDAARRELGSDARAYSQAMLQIRKNAKACLTDDSACAPYITSDLPRVTWPRIPEIPEMVLVSSCKLDKLFVVGAKITTGEDVGVRSYEVLAIGDSLLFDHLIVSDSDGNTPVALLKPDDPMVKSEEQLAKVARFPDDNCIDRSPDRRQGFGAYLGRSILRHGVDQTVTFELHDKLGRISYFHLN
jgi:hypothetical protein